MSLSTGRSVKKSQKSGYANGEDYISSLPESVIGDILSRLPADEAVRTCVLSKDWESKWISSYDFYIDDTRVVNSCGAAHKMFSFVNFVYRILHLSRDMRCITLNCRAKYDSSLMIAWIYAVLRQNVQFFALTNPASEGLLIPRSLLTSVSLRVLKLELPCTCKVHSNNLFPNLLDLYLVGVEIQNELSNSDTLTLTFPVLQTMELKECKWLNVKFVEIIAPTLTKFTSQTPYNARVDDYSIKILEGRLINLDFFGQLPENIILTESSSVTHASLHNTEDSWDIHFLESGLQVRMLLNGFQNLEDLSLSGWMTEAIAQSKEGLALPRFDELRRLTIDSCANIEALLELLHATPYLKSLVVYMYHEPVGYDYETVESLPYCLVNQLEEVEFLDYSFPLLEYDFALEKFLLKNGLVLKTFHPRCVDDKKKKILKILDSLLEFPKGSDCLNFVIN